MSQPLKKLTVGLALCAATRRLKAADVDQPRRDARLLLAEALRLPPERLLTAPERPVDDLEAATFDGMVARRASREPVSRILGRREFWGLSFRLSRETLDPRPDSETLVEAAIERLDDCQQAPARLLDLGTGSGCLLLALLSEYPESWGLGIDLSLGALATARANAVDLGVSQRAAFAVMDWTAAIAGAFDTILCNPPYVAEGAGLAPEVAAYDPPAALYAGSNGLSAYRRLVPSLLPLLAPGGWALLELGAGQAAAVSALGRAAGFSKIEIKADLSGTPRCLALAR